MGLGISIAVNGTPDAELAQAESVEVYESMGEPTRYRISYALDIADGDLPLLTESRLGPGSQLSVFAANGTLPHCLVQGPVHGQRLTMAHGGEGSTLEVLGGDRLVEMDRESKSAVWAEVTDSDVATSILSGYGMIPDVEQTRGRHTEAKHTLVQRDTDFRFLQRLARRSGLLLWVTTDGLGIETAHFKRPDLNSSEDAELIINLDAANLDQLEIDWDMERPTQVQTKQLDLNTVEAMDGSVPQSPQTPLGESPLTGIGAGPRSLFLSAPVDDAGDLTARAEGVLVESDWFLHARCKTTIEAVGSPVRAHTVVNLRGAGSRHSGRYYVTSVRHQIDATEHSMDVELMRNAWGG